MDFNKKTKPQIPEKKGEKKEFLMTYMHFLRAEKEFLMLLKVKHFKEQVFQTKSRIIAKY